ncbi:MULTISPECIES: heme-degrading domain-containing protein [Streptomyces]|uniref:Heme-degrading domain-containing protein n=1 Tax=Streptomyces evansiae TaxID=3075535 RepID=A0ABU2R1L4_9ACTN|nr:MULTISPECIES: heme-degrading domain-containing protein [unclassified Streptomyces]MDT0409289.1 heme-degrading domain-containing protein [Streptomyces sp. DSM 41979]MYQ61343.1 heme-degrading domain-containing protein [Streptomyces sp. SID4926]WEH29512.1 heme-degrading domain-containing protein [Streptomyces sp. AM 3-1-1]SCE47447.1 Uncharacterized protein, UPF0303 family [Streptomyces sp. DfronAA-171]
MSALPATAGEIADLLAQQNRLELPTYTHDDAWDLGSTLVRLAREADAPVAIDLRRGLQQVFHAALPGSTADNDDWLARKRRVVERYGESSLLVGTRFRAKGTTFEDASRLDPSRYAAHGGVLPILVRGVSGPVGTIGVSGLPQVEDHALVVATLEEYLAGR